mmetsp:Transcript_68737/g.191757  ORF Transcript_68737/g.191757 Transcript_68737/m.191757 type:complete len:120 (-) Transcript_68737:50-409(-)
MTAAYYGHRDCVERLLRAEVPFGGGLESVEELLKEAAADKKEEDEMAAMAACFAGDGRVLLADGTTQKRVDTIEVGDQVFTPSGPASVLLISMSKPKDGRFKGCKVNGLVICSDHPIQV